MEAWLEWEAVTLAPAERQLAAAHQAGGSAPREGLAALKHLEGKITEMWLVDGVRFNGGICQALVELAWMKRSTPFKHLYASYTSLALSQ